MHGAAAHTRYIESKAKEASRIVALLLMVQVTWNMGVTPVERYPKDMFAPLSSAYLQPSSSKGSSLTPQQLERLPPQDMLGILSASNMKPVGVWQELLQLQAMISSALQAPSPLQDYHASSHVRHEVWRCTQLRSTIPSCHATQCLVGVAHMLLPSTL
ncbi:unnamed protein product [Symbiodinium natans]|uniref:Uncharacterized protein n=1 Tax=Symbiodinium natans TaxID=878477 RepID=A0A812V828_9DINO|nr:unnamed protein product [Symbiodinium natans]